MILDVDIGNTFTKWRVMGEPLVQRQLTADLEHGWQCQQVGVERVRIACVAANTALQCILRVAQARWGCLPEIAVVRQGVAGLQPCYQDLSRLGVDRWLAMLAAYSAYQSACVVVSLGSAITADWVASDGRHLGGLIVPGRQKMLDSLYSGVANVLREPTLPALPNLALGNTTNTCVANGIAAMCAGFVAHIALQQPGWPVWVAGGDAQAMLDLCAQGHKSQWQLAQTLVLDGLAIALP